MRAIVSRFTIESSSVSTRASRNVVTTLGVSTCEQRLSPAHVLCTYHLPSFLSPPLFISPSPLFIPRSVCGHGDELLTRATIRSEGFLLQSSHYVYGITCVYLLSPSNSTARCLQFQWNLSTRVEQAVDVAKIPSLFPRINIRELYPLRRR